MAFGSLACAPQPMVPEWTLLPTEEPLGSEMEDEIRKWLTEYYHFCRKDEFRRETKICWIHQEGFLTLETSVFTRRVILPQLRRLCNKPTILYWAHAAQINDRCPTFIFGCIYKKWFQYYNDNPNIEFGHFLASPVRITSTGPTTIAGILEAHKSLCHQVSSLLDLYAHGNAEQDHFNYRLNLKNYKLLPLCRAIIIVLDELAPDEDPNADGSIILDEVSQEQSVLLVGTGDESLLSAPVSFESISAESLLPRRGDVAAEGDVNVVRVSLATAVRFIADLQRREDASFATSEDSPVDTSLCPTIPGSDLHAVTAEMWTNKIMEEAQRKGIDNVVETWDAVRQVKAAKRGEVFAKLTPYHFDSRWK